MNTKMSNSSISKITINGWYGQLNAGDDAILQVFIEQVTRRLNCNVVVLTEYPENIKTDKNLDCKFHMKFTNLGTIKSLFNGNLISYLRNLYSSDLFVLGGGGLLRDNTTWSNLFRLLDEIWLSKLFGRKVMLYAIGVGPFKSRLGKYIIGLTVKLCDLITVRDAISAKLLVEIGVPSERIHIVADPAFLLEPEAPHDPLLLNILSDRNMIGLFPEDGLLGDERDFSCTILLANALDELVEKAGLQFVSFPMFMPRMGIDDVAVSFAIKSAMKHPEAMHIYEKQLTPAELKWTTGRTKLNITVRLHAMIFSLGSHVPVVAINYEPKVANVFSALNCPEYLIEIENLDKTLPSAVMRCLDNLSDYSQKISEVMGETKISALRTFDLIQTLSSKN